MFARAELFFAIINHTNMFSRAKRFLNAVSITYNLLQTCNKCPSYITTVKALPCGALHISSIDPRTGEVLLTTECDSYDENFTFSVGYAGEGAPAHTVTHNK